VDEEHEITVKGLKRLLYSGVHVNLIDVREPHEYDFSHISGSRLIPVRQIPNHVNEFTPRVLSMRLRDLIEEGLVDRMGNPKHRLDVRYRLTKKGRDCMPILTAFIQYGMLYRAERVFADKQPRNLNQVFPEKQKPLLGQLIAYAAMKPNK
jgi:DNA-binding HxlR family transcriptional regulator